MVSFYGDYDTTETVVIPFNTFTSDDPSASSTITNLAATDIHIHKDGGLTQRSSANGVAVVINFDSITGNHLVTIDLSDNTDAGFYAAGSRYQVRMEGTTVDGATINAWIGAFSIGRTLSIANLANLASACAAYSATRGLTGTALPAAAADAAGGVPISDVGGLDLDAKLANTNEVTAARMGALTDWIDGGRLDLILDIVAADVVNLDGAAMRGTNSAALASVCTEARLAELDTANLPTDVANVKTDTAAILIDTAVIGAAGAGLTAIPWNAAWDAEVQSECADALTAYGASTLTAAQVNTEVDTALADINLDHLVGTATAIPAVPAGTFLDQIMDDGTASFDRTTDSLQAVRDRGDTAWITATGFALASVCTEGRLAELDAANLPTDVADKTGYALSATGADLITSSATFALAVADAVLARSVATVEASAAEWSLCTVILAMLESSISGTTWTIKRTNGSTTHATKTVTVDADADPITGVS